MRLFHLERKKDLSGVSGVGRVAEGVEFHDGQCVLSWFGLFHSISVWPCIDDIIKVHGHEGATEVVFAAQPARLCNCDECENLRENSEIPEEIEHE